jgi:cell wall-associated NlpC family hydrolase
MRPASAVIDLARTWVGVPFRHQGRSREGIDCVGLAIVVGRELGLLPADFDATGYARRPTDGRLLEEIAERCTPAPGPEPASLIVVRWNRDPHHVAICTGPTLIHALSTVGRVVEHGYRHPWPKLTQSVWRLPGVAY